LFLKELQIRGFKSFADPAKLELEPGVTVVVGPNGSGKSNVVDAIGWVLGAQAPSAVRSQKMDDVIFAGSAKRPALGRAEVALTIDNSGGLLPIEFNEVTISRTLFRNGDSEYAINGAEVRLLDIQELLSDSGVGRQQHVIISQGQIDAVLNARPEDRRLIIEEAAGVLKFRRRKEKAERRLAATEANLVRITDTIREVRRQLRPLEKQADAARRHESVLFEARALRTHLLGRDIARLTQLLADGERERLESKRRERELLEQLSRLDAAVLAAEARVSAIGGPSFSDALVRTESLSERAQGLLAVLVERERGLARERRSFIDETVVASLESEAAEGRAALSALDAEGEDLADLRAALADAEAALLTAQAAFDGTPSGEAAQIAVGADDAAAPLTAEQVRARIAAVSTVIANSQREHERLQAEQARRATLAAELEAERAAAETQRGELIDSVQDRQRALSEAEAAVVAADETLVAAREEARSAAARRNRWEARAEALQQALEESHRRSGLDHVSALPGVLGTLADLVTIEDGWELAVAAAVEGGLDAVVVDSGVGAAEVFEALRAAAATATVLAAPTRAAAPIHDDSLRRRVHSTHGPVERLLDALCAPVLCTETVEAAVRLALARPEATVVTREGDRLSPQGWTLSGSGAAATRAALDEAIAEAAGAVEAQQAAAAGETAAREALRVAREAQRSAEKTLGEHRSAAERAVATLERVGSRLDELAAAQERAGVILAEVAQRSATDRNELGALESRLPDLEDVERRQSELLAAREAAQTEVVRREHEVSESQHRLAVALTSVEERRRSLTARLATIEDRLAAHVEARRAAELRRVELEARSEVIAALVEVVQQRAVLINEALDLLRAARDRHVARTREITTELTQLRSERGTTERNLTEVRERLQRSEIADTETRLRLEGLTETCRNELDCEPQVAVGAPLPLIPAESTPLSRLRELERDLKLMGPINPLALEEFSALSERAEHLDTQHNDVRAARRELAKVIQAVDEEITSVFASAFADVAENFTRLFDTLFPGGAGSLKLTEPGDLLNTGIEIEARPSGKNVKKLSLLSGGERSLTALAYLFAVFRSRPSPFYVMDEVEAALDDVNLHRFLGLVAEFRSTAQLLIVSHQKRTMEAADVLYGVTMEPGGSSRVISERVSVGAD
jgi:chromosome segregation protein